MAPVSTEGRVHRGIVAALVAAALVLPLGLAGCGLVGQQAATSPPENVTTMSTKYAGDRGSAQLAPQLAGGAAESAGVPAPGGSGTDASTVPASDKLIIRNKTLRLEVKDVEGTITKVRDLAKRDGADITQMQVATTTDEPIYRPVDQTGTGGNTALRAFVTIRVPADKYEAFIDDAAKLGDVKFQTEDTQDVTQQHIDLSARLTNLRAEEAQLREFFAKARNVGEMIQIEQELSRVRGEIESMAAQVAYLERQAAMATVTLELTEPKPVVRPTGIDWGTRDAFTKSIQAFVGTLNVLIVILGPVLALLIFVALPVFLVVRALWRRNKRRDADAAKKASEKKAPEKKSSREAHDAPERDEAPDA